MRFFLKASIAGVLWSGAGASWVQAAPAPPIEVSDAAAPMGNVLLTLLVDRLHTGELSVDDAWRAGELKVEDALYLLGNASDWGAIEGCDNVPLRHALAKLIIEQDKEQLGDKLKGTPLKARLWLADYLQAQKDIRCVEVAESVLSEFKTAAIDYPSQALLFLSVERIAWFYREDREYTKSAQTWARMPSVVGNTDWMLADAIWQAGRMYLWAGKPDEAEPYFVKAKSYKHPLFSSLVTYDQASALLGQGKHREARQLLNQGLFEVREPVGRGIQLMMLAKSYYSTAEFDRAQQFAQETLDEAAKAGKVNPSIGFDAVINAGYDVLKWSQLWKEKPLVCLPQKLVHRAESQKKGLLWKTRLTVRSFRLIPLTVSSDDPRIKCVVQPVQNDPWFPNREDRFVEQIVEVEAPLDAALQTNIYVTSDQFPLAAYQIPLQIVP